MLYSGPHCLSILNVIVCIYEPQTLSPSHSLPPPPWQPQEQNNHCSLCYSSKFFFLSWPPHGIWNSWARDQIRLQLQPKPQAQQWRILHPLCWVRDRTCVPALPRCCQSCCVTVGTPTVPIFVVVNTLIYLENFPLNLTLIFCLYPASPWSVITWPVKLKSLQSMKTSLIAFPVLALPLFRKWDVSLPSTPCPPKKGSLKKESKKTYCNGLINYRTWSTGLHK